MTALKFPALMKSYIENQSEVLLAGSTVAQMFEDLLLKYPVLKPHLFDADKNLRRHFNVFVNGVHIRELNGMDTPVKEGDNVLLMASAAGG